MSSNQKKIRDIERQMKKFGSDNPELIRRLEELKATKEDVQIKEKLKKNSVKYHMVKFIERKKVTRAIRSIDTKITKADADVVEEFKRKRKELEEDLAYIMYYPMEQKYIALFPGSDKGVVNTKQVNSKAYEQQAAQIAEKSVALSKSARVLAIEAWKQDIARGRVDKVAHAMEVEYNGGNGAKQKKKDKAEGGGGDDEEEEAEYHKYTNNLQPSSALDQYQARIGRDLRLKNEAAHDGGEDRENANTAIKRKRPDSGERVATADHSSSAVASSSSSSKKHKSDSGSGSSNSSNNNFKEQAAAGGNNDSVNAASSKKDKSNKKNDRTTSTTTATTVAATAAAMTAKEEPADPFFLEEVDEEEEARLEVVEQKMKKNLSELADIRQVVNRNKHDTHKRLYGTKTHDHSFRQNKNHKKF